MITGDLILPTRVRKDYKLTDRELMLLGIVYTHHIQNMECKYELKEIQSKYNLTSIASIVNCNKHLAELGLIKKTKVGKSLIYNLSDSFIEKYIK